MISSGFDENNHEKDAFAVKHVFATNTGLHIFDSVSKLFCERNLIDTGDSLVEQCVDQLIKDVKSNLSVEDLSRVMKDSHRSFNLKASLLGCASYGVREFQVGADKSKRFSE